MKGSSHGGEKIPERVLLPWQSPKNMKFLYSEMSIHPTNVQRKIPSLFRQGPIHNLHVASFAQELELC
jgi:hypothetical protein